MSVDSTVYDKCTDKAVCDTCHQEYGETVTTDDEATKADSAPSPKTGDDFNMMILMALLIASCGVIVATTLYRRRSTK